MGYGSMSSGDTQLRPMPGSMDDVEAWDGIKEGKGWFLHMETNDWGIQRSGASVTITEGDHHKYSIQIKTRGLRKPNDTNESHRQKVRKHADKVARAWVTEAKKLYNNPEINEVGNELPITWNEAFRRALDHPKVQSQIERWSESKMNPYKGSSAVADPTNFTQRLEENYNPLFQIIYWVKFVYEDEKGVQDDALQEFESPEKANKFIDQLQAKKMPYECYVQLPPERGLHDDKDQKGWNFMKREYKNGGVQVKFKIGDEDNTN
jgi:hypothetical protein